MDIDGAVAVAVKHADEEPASLRVEVTPVVVEQCLSQLHCRDLARVVSVHGLFGWAWHVMLAMAMCERGLHGLRVCSVTVNPL